MRRRVRFVTATAHPSRQGRDWVDGMDTLRPPLIPQQYTDVSAAVRVCRKWNAPVQRAGAIDARIAFC